MAPRPTKKSKPIVDSSDDDDELNLVWNPDDSSSDVEELEVEIVGLKHLSPRQLLWRNGSMLTRRGREIKVSDKFYWHYNA